VLKTKEPEPDLLEEIDLEVLASRNFECLLEYEDKKNEKLNYWQ
jgi:hypothetical protein